jgi:anti-anti-sigma factor
MMKTTIHPENGTLCLAGTLDMYAAETLHRTLRETVSDKAEICLALGDVESCDLTAIQLLQAARQSAAARGKAMRIEKVSPAIRQCLSQIGLPESHFD